MSGTGDMATARNGHHGKYQLRFDGLLKKWPGDDESGYSGRRFVLAALLALAVLWGGLYLIFRDWRARYRERAAYGATQVATTVDPLARMVPPGENPEAWRRAVADTHAMIVTLTASNMLDLAKMQALRTELTARVARARPETARHELAAIWDDLSDRAGPVVAAPRHPRPGILPRRVGGKVGRQ